MPTPSSPPVGVSEPPEERDYHDGADASRRELLIYGMGGILDEIGMAAFRNLTYLLSIGFGFSPLIAGFLGGIRMLWDGIMDPVVAHSARRDINTLMLIDPEIDADRRRLDPEHGV